MARFDKLEINTPQQKPSPAKTPEPKRDDFDAPRWMEEADKSRRAGSYEEALKYYSRALEKDRSLVGGWVGQVQMLVFLDELPEADLWARKALELFPAHGDLFAARGQALCRMGDLKQAYALCDTAFQKSGQSAYCWMARGEILLAARNDKDVYCFDKAHEADHDWLVMLEIALIYQFYHQPGKALPWARRAVEAAVSQPFAWYVQGLSESELGFDNNARQSFRRCMDLNPRNIDAAQKLVELDRRHWSPFRFFRRFFRK
jgi:tetratricopeptide (TPR) repeat protein